LDREVQFRPTPPSGGEYERKGLNMRILTLLTIPALFATLAFAESWSGALLDASCYDKQAQQPTEKQGPAQSYDQCAATSSTSNFALHTSAGKVFKLDSAGNSKASSAFKNRAERSAPGQTASKAVMATVEGSESGGTIKVDKIDIQ